MTLLPPSPRVAAALAAGTVAALALPSAAGAASWQFAPALAPPPPPGAAPAPFPVALGRVGDIRFWSRDRGVLITAGTQSSVIGPGVVPPSVYAYDGVAWHQLSTVCGGSDGRIAWAGPREFWTIADQRPGQVSSGVTLDTGNVSLCHFKDGVVVGSYALPLGQPDSYRPMNAAACRTADDCWFAGARALRPARGGFHLHWDGTTVTPVYASPDHAAGDLAPMQTQLYESVRLAADDDFGAEDPNAPTLLRTIAPPGSSAIFRNVVPADSACAGEPFCPPLPDYGSDERGRPVAPLALEAFDLDSDWSLAGGLAGAPQLWALASRSPSGAPVGSGDPHAIVLRLSGGSWTQVVPRLGDFDADLPPRRIAAEPGRAAAYVVLDGPGDSTYASRLLADGTVDEPQRLGVPQGVGDRGGPGPIACPAPSDCWVATDRGWLFHLTDGAQLPRDDDPAFAGVITFRPPDGGVPFAPPDDPQADNSLANQLPAPPPTPIVRRATTPRARRTPRRIRAKPLVSRTKTSMVHRTTLRLTFTLSAKAHVQLIALRHGKVVARSAKRTLSPGRRSVQVRLQPRRWPTKLDLKATPVKGHKQKSPSRAGGDDTQSSTTIG